MAESENTTIEMLRGELNKLSSQVENIVKSIENKKGVDVSELVDKLTKEISGLRANASDRAHQLYDAGQAGIEEVGSHVRNNPLASILIAFGAGCIMSCLIRHLSK